MQRQKKWLKIGVWSVLIVCTVYNLITLLNERGILLLRKVPEILVEDDITYMKFPVEKLQELPEEPDWENDLTSWKILDEELNKENRIERMNEFIEEEIKRSGADEFIYVNQNGDIMMPEPISEETQINKWQVFFRSKKDGLVKIDIEPYDSIRREEYHTHTQRIGLFKDTRYVGSSEIINSTTGHWKNIDNTVYYLIKYKEEWENCEITKGESISGFVETLDEQIAYPIIEIDDKPYVYVVENAIPYNYAYYTQTKPEIKKIDLSEMEGICEIYEGIFGEIFMEAEIGVYRVYLDIPPSNILKLGENQDFSECFSKIETFYYSREESRTEMYWKKDGDAKVYIY